MIELFSVLACTNVSLPVLVIDVLTVLLLIRLVMTCYPLHNATTTRQITIPLADYVVGMLDRVGFTFPVYRTASPVKRVIMWDRVAHCGSHVDCGIINILYTLRVPSVNKRIRDAAAILDTVSRNNKSLRFV